MRSRRFREYKLSGVVLLFEGGYDECDAMEEYYINEYDTFKNGLNLTNRGKGKNLSNKFNTLGYKFSESSRKKMSQSAKERTDRLRGYKPSNSTRDIWKKQRKGKYFGERKIDSTLLIKEWEEFSPTEDDMNNLIYKTIDGKSYYRNGREFNHYNGKLQLFKSIKSKELNVSKQAIGNVINEHCIRNIN